MTQTQYPLFESFTSLVRLDVSSPLIELIASPSLTWGNGITKSNFGQQINNNMQILLDVKFGREKLSIKVKKKMGEKVGRG